MMQLAIRGFVWVPSDRGARLSSLVIVGTILTLAF